MDMLSAIRTLRHCLLPRSARSRGRLRRRVPHFHPRLEVLEKLIVPGFLAGATYPVANNGGDVVIRDLNGDGFPDTASTRSNATNTIVMIGINDGTGALSLLTELRQPSGGSAAFLTALDFDQDGVTDLAVSGNTTIGRLHVFRGNGDGTFRHWSSHITQPNARTVEAEDLNLDGYPDLVVLHSSASTSTLYSFLNDGYSGLYFIADVNVGRSASSIIPGDFNNDWVPDIVAGNSGTSGMYTVVLGKGDGTFDPFLSAPAGRNPLSLGKGDFNGDGYLDFVVSRTTPGAASVFLNNGDSTFTEVESHSLGTQTREVAVGDMNGDGFLDVAVAVHGPNVLSILLGNGDGTFRPGGEYEVGAQPYAVAMDDMNLDGLLDVVITRAGLGLTVFLNDGDWSGLAPGVPDPNPKGLGRLAPPIQLLLTTAPTGPGAVAPESSPARSSPPTAGQKAPEVQPTDAWNRSGRQETPAPESRPPAVRGAGAVPWNVNLFVFTWL